MIECQPPIQYSYYNLFINIYIWLRTVELETNDYLTAPNCVLKLFVILAAIPLLDVCGEPELDPAPDGDGPLLPLHHGGHQQKVGIEGRHEQSFK